MSQVRIKDSHKLLPEAMKVIQGLKPAVDQGGVPESTLGLVHLRTSQINGCGFCVDIDARGAAKAAKADGADETELLRHLTVAAWRETPYFTDAERAALALTEAVTRLADRPDPVPDEIWDEAAKHYDDEAMVALLVWIGTCNLYNRLNVPMRQPAGAWG